MNYEKSYDSITKKVLNETSGELEVVDFVQYKTRKHIKGGFSMSYKSYEEAVENILTSKLDFSILLEIKNQFTYKRIEVVVSAQDIAKKLGCSKQKVTDVINKMVKEHLLCRVARGVYRLNPHMYIPFKSDGEELQREWNILQKKAKEDFSEDTEST